MSACLLSLSVISLVLPVISSARVLFRLWLTCLQTAFHASFSDLKLADTQSLKISRGTSVVGNPISSVAVEKKKKRKKKKTKC